MYPLPERQGPSSINSQAVPSSSLTRCNNELSTLSDLATVIAYISVLEISYPILIQPRVRRE